MPMPMPFENASEYWNVCTYSSIKLRFEVPYKSQSYQTADPDNGGRTLWIPDSVNSITKFTSLFRLSKTVSWIKKKNKKFIEDQ